MRIYNTIAGRSKERLAALSDGVFAFALTVLVLDIRPPDIAGIHSERDLMHALAVLSPRLVPFVMSFMTLGIFWVGQQTQLNHLARASRDLAWLHIAFLAAISLMPFSTALLAEFVGYRIALLVYWGDVLMGGVALYAAWRYAGRAGLVKPDTPAEASAAIGRRSLVAQSLYALGALLCVFDTHWSIAFIVLVQLNYAIAPRIPFLSRL